MHCRNCNYEGEPEYGEFPIDIEIGYKPHIRCPKCKDSRKITIESWELVKEVILYPEYCYGSPDWIAIYGKGHIKTQRAVSILNGKTIDGYSIYCPVCEWGEGGGLPKGRTEELRKLFVEVNLR